MTSWRQSAVRGASLALAATGVTTLERRLRHARQDKRVFIVEYHDIARDDDGEREGTISAARLRRHLRFLKKRFAVVSLEEAVAALAGAKPLRTDMVVVTLDDGYAGNFDPAWPILREEEIPAAIFLTSGFLDGAPLWFDVARRVFEKVTAPGVAADGTLAAAIARVLPATTDARGAVNALKRMPTERRDDLLRRIEPMCGHLAPAAAPLSWDQVREMASQGATIGCHTVSHPILSALDPEQQEREIVQARDRIADELGAPPVYFAYPNGSRRDFDQNTVEILARNGFTAALATTRGSNRPGCDLFRIHRLGVGADPNFVLAARFAGLFDEWVRGLAGRAPEAAHLRAAGTVHGS